MKNYQVLFNSNDFKIYISECLKEFSSADKNYSTKIKKNKTFCREKKLVFTNFNCHFFYGLVFYVQKYYRFRISLHKYLSCLIKYIEEACVKTDSILNSIYFIDMNLLLTDVSGYKNKSLSCQKITKEKFDIFAFNLVCESQIIRQW